VHYTFKNEKYYVGIGILYIFIRLIELVSEQPYHWHKIEPPVNKMFKNIMCTEA